MLSEQSMPEEGLFLESSVQLVELLPCTGGLCHVGDRISVRSVTSPVDGGLLGRKWVCGYLGSKSTYGGKVMSGSVQRGVGIAPLLVPGVTRRFMRQPNTFFFADGPPLGPFSAGLDTGVSQGGWV